MAIPTPRVGRRSLRTGEAARGRAHPVRPLMALGLTILLVGVLLVPMASAQESRQQRFEDHLETIRVLQNMDGGFGDVETVGDPSARTYATVRSDASVMETAVTVDLLLREGQDPLAIHRNWQDHKTSLAASSVPNALDWLRGMEAERSEQLDPGALALAAVAYDRLDDEANAARLVEDIVRDLHEGTRTFDAVDRAQLVYAGRTVGLAPSNETLNQTWNSLQTQVQGRADAGALANAWALAAFPQDPAHHDALVAAVDVTLDRASGTDDADGQTARTLDKEGLALAAWSLALHGDGTTDANVTIAAVDEVYRAVPYSTARAWVMMAEVALFPYISTTVPELTSGANLDAAAEGRRGALEDAGAALGDSDGAPATDGVHGSGDALAFPLPGWAIMLGIVLAMAAIATVSLAYGLKKEDLKGVRKQVFEYIETHPGEHFSKIRRDLGLAAGTFQHHLNVLETEGWITSFKESRYKRYFVNGNRYQTLIKGRSTDEYKGKFAALKNDTSRELVRFLATNPGATQKQVAQRFNLHASTVNWHANRLKQVGILQGERVGKEVRYVVDSDTVDKLLRE